MRRVSLSLMVVLLLVGLAPVSASASPQLELDAVAMVNAERRERGLAELRVVDDLTTVARRHAQTMANDGRLFHNPTLSSDVSNWQRLAENVGVGRDIGVIHDAYMNSSGHRANILDPNVTEIGIGVVTKDQRRWQTQIFRRPVRATATTVAGFKDVTTTSTHATAIRQLVAKGITDGCAPNRFCPGNPVTRAQLATFLARTFDLPARTPTGFTDVPTSHPHAGSIGALAQAGIVNGCAANRYCPDDTVNRAQMASMLTRAFELQRANPNFVDVSNGAAHSREIGGLARAGVTNGCASQRYCPSGAVTRAEMASFLTRAMS